MLIRRPHGVPASKPTRACPPDSGNTNHSTSATDEQHLTAAALECFVGLVIPDYLGQVRTCLSFTVNPSSNQCRRTTQHHLLPSDRAIRSILSTDHPASAAAACGPEQILDRDSTR